MCFAEPQKIRNIKKKYKIIKKKVYSEKTKSLIKEQET
jgi:hypothetical protein